MEIKLPDEFATLESFKPGDKVWYFSFGLLNHVFPGIIKCVEDRHYVVWKYAEGIWVERFALPSHLSIRDYDVSYDIFIRRTKILKGIDLSNVSS